MSSNLVATIAETLSMRLQHELTFQVMREDIEQVRALTAFSMDWEYWLLPDGSMAYMSPSCEQITGYNPAEFMADPSLIQQVVHPDDREKLSGHMRAVGLRKDSVAIDLRVQDLDGNLRWFSHMCHPVFGSSGEYRGRRVVNRDITDRYQVANELRDSERRFQLLFDHIRDPILIHEFGEQPGRFEEVNQAACDVMGYSRAELLQLTPLDLLEPEDLADVPGEASQIGADRAGRFVKRIKAKQGTLIPVELNTTLIEWEDRTMAVSICRDMRERLKMERVLRESEQRLRMINELVTDNAYVLSVSHGNTLQLEWSNEQFEQISGLRRGIPFKPGDVTALIHPADRARHVDRMQRLLGNQEDVTEYRVLIDGQELWIRDYGKPIWDDTQGQVVAIIGASQDISERRRLEQAVQQHEADLLAIVGASAEGMIVVGRDGVVVFANPAACSIFGRSEESLIGEEFGIPVVTDGMHAIELLQPDGSLRYAELRRVSVVWKGDAAHLVSLYDYTERLKAEESLRRSEERYRMISEISTDYAFALKVEPDGTTVREWVTPSYDLITGYTAAERDEQGGWIFPVHPDDIPRVGAAFRQLMRTGSPQVMEFRITRKDGQIRWLRAETQAQYNRAGRIARLLGSGKDVTEQHTTTARLRLIEAALNASAGAVVITDRNGEIEWVNPAFTGLTGYSWEEAVGQNPRLLRSDRQSLVFYEQLWHTILAGDVWRGELINRRKDGSHYHEEMTITPVKDEDGAISRFIAIKQDISERIVRDQSREALAAIALALRSAQTQAEMIPTLLEQIIMMLQADWAVIGLRDPASGAIVFEYGAGDPGPLLGAHLAPGESVSGGIVATGQSYLSTNVPEDPAFARPELLGTTRSAIGAALRSSDQVIGVIWVGTYRVFGTSDLHTLETIADFAGGALHRTRLFESTRQQMERLKGLHAIDTAISNILDLRMVLYTVVDQATRLLAVDAADILLLDAWQQTLTFAAGQHLPQEALAAIDVRLGEGVEGELALNQRHCYIANLLTADNRLKRQAIIRAEGFVAYYGVPLVVKGNIRGILEVFHREPLRPDPDWTRFLETLAGQAAIAIDNAGMFDGLQRANTQLVLAYDETIEGWARALDLRDKETEGHSRRVTELTVRLARAFSLPSEVLAHIRRGALLHDIGKMGVPDHILLKPGKLTPEEWAIMQQHPALAYQLLAPITFLRPALDIPYCHHEKWDGSGYPRGLKGDEIPLAARLFAVVDVWDALGSDRPYRAAWPPDQIREHILAGSGTHFDPQVVEAFLQLI
jgi:PAS domain S-box-containing protein